MIDHVEVVVPAHDEGARIADALRAIDDAASRVPVSVRVHVVLHRCGDDTADVIGATSTTVPVAVVSSDARTVGAARALGVARATAGRHPGRTWIASTDADSTVPPNWLQTHLAFADAGMAAVVGSVAVRDWSGRPASLEALFRVHYDLARGPAPIHGANLGVRLDAYTEAGGFGPVACGEDEALVAALRGVGATIAYTTAAPVITSARLDGRAVGGFADTLTEWSSPLADPGVVEASIPGP